MMIEAEGQAPDIRSLEAACLGVWRACQMMCVDRPAPAPRNAARTLVEIGDVSRVPDALNLEVGGYINHECPKQTGAAHPEPKGA